MPKAIFKYRLDIPLTSIQMPDEAQLLEVHEQDGDPFLWALVDNDKPHRTRQILTVGTGWQTDLETMDGDTIPYIGTAHIDGFVWHAFDGGYA